MTWVTSDPPINLVKTLENRGIGTGERRTDGGNGEIANEILTSRDHLGALKTTY